MNECIDCHVEKWMLMVRTQFGQAKKTPIELVFPASSYKAERAKMARNQYTVSLRV
jgi:hypothetical protein